MRRLFYFISHPNVVVDKVTPVPRWHLSAHGRSRMIAGLRQPWVDGLTAVYSSTELKAIDGAEILANYLCQPFRTIAELGENDRSSTGFLPPHEFEQVADEFFAHPNTSIRGWERAVDAQARIVTAVTAIAASDATTGSIAIMSHGAVGTLLYCWLQREPIARRWDQPSNGGGNYFPFSLHPPTAHGHWQALDAVLGSEGT